MPKAYELSPTQRKIADQIGDFGWIGSNNNHKTCVLCPDGDAMYGDIMSEATLKALLAKGVFRHGKLSDQQRAEFTRRMNAASAKNRFVRRTIPTHGYLYFLHKD